jgi:hypothetical protein
MSVERPFPYVVTVDHDRNAIILKGIGDAMTDETLQLIYENRSTFFDNPGYDVIYDAIELRITSSAADMVRVADALFGEGAPPIGRFAVVVPREREQLAMMFSALAERHGVTANVFTDRGDAWKWFEGRRGAA